MKVYTTFILSASITRGVTYAKLTHTVAEGRYTTAPYLFPATDMRAKYLVPLDQRPVLRHALLELRQVHGPAPVGGELAVRRLVDQPPRFAVAGDQRHGRGQGAGVGRA